MLQNIQFCDFKFDVLKMDSGRDLTHCLVDYDDSSSEEESEQERTEEEEHAEIVEDFVRYEPEFHSMFLRLELRFKDVDPERMPLEEIEKRLKGGLKRSLNVKSRSAKVELNMPKWIWNLQPFLVKGSPSRKSESAAVFMCSHIHIMYRVEHPKLSKF